MGREIKEEVVKADKVALERGSKAITRSERFFNLHLAFIGLNIFLICNILFFEGLSEKNEKDFMFYLGGAIFFGILYSSETKIQIYVKMKERLLSIFLKTNNALIAPFGDALEEVAKFSIKLIGWVLLTGIIASIGFLFFGWLGSLSVSTLLIILLAVVLLK